MTLPTSFKPMLAVSSDKLKALKFPYYASPKLDGIRCCIFGGVAYSRSLKQIPNKSVQAWANKHSASLEGLDGELIVGSPAAPDVFNVTTSAIMQHEGSPDFKFYVFDLIEPQGFDFSTRLLRMQQRDFTFPDRVSFLKQKLVQTQEDLNAYESKCLEYGYEGVMLKAPSGFYKCGRSGTTNPEIIKVKRFVDSEFEIVGFEALYSNQNEAEIDELGHTKRSTKKEGLIAQETLGKILCKTSDGIVFGVGSGFTQAQREDMWKTKDNLIGKLAKVKYFEVGVKDAPRFPVFIGIRAKEDL